jgi:membrane protease YdiL (CAAX protease family)
MDEKRNHNNSTGPGWEFCPNCGYKLPKLKDLKFCVSCGIDLLYLKEHKKMPEMFIINEQVGTPITHEQYYGFKEASYKKLASEDLPGYSETKLWSGGASIGLTIASYFLMTFGAVIIIFIMLLASLPSIDMLELISNPYFLIISSLTEILLIVLPLWYVGRYLEVPSLKNRFGLLGVTIKGLSKKLGFFKEILIGIAFAIVGILLVLGVSFLIEVLLEFIFGVDILRNVASGSGDIQIIIASSDITALILIMIVMIFVIGTSEEILFRGFLQKGLVRKVGQPWGIMIAALIFTSVHVFDSFLLYPIGSLYFILSFLLTFCPYFAISLLLGLIYYWRKENLIAVMLTHGLYDALTILMVFLLLS